MKGTEKKGGGKEELHKSYLHPKSSRQNAPLKATLRQLRVWKAAKTTD